MSGFEIAGVALAVLPVAVKALKGYTELLSSVKNFRNTTRNLRALIRDLEIEEDYLKRTCEFLLNGLVPFYAIDKLIEQPDSDDWKEYDEKIRARLGTSKSISIFRDVISEIHEAVEALNTLLGIDNNNQTKTVDRGSILKQFKQRASFTLNRKDFDDLIQRINKNNIALRKLVDDSCFLEPVRKRRCQAKFVSVIRKVSSGVSRAIDQATTCQCSPSHELCLELEPRKTTIYGDAEEELAKSIQFHVLLGSHCLFTKPRNGDYTRKQQHQNSSQERLRWNNIEIRTLVMPREHLSLEIGSSVHVPEYLAAVQTSRTVRFTSRDQGGTSTHTIIESANRVPPHKIAENLRTTIGAIPDLCGAVCSNSKQRAVECYGHISDSKYEFGVFQPTTSIESQQAVTLREILEQSATNNHEWTFSSRIRVALAISAGVLHLFNTPWMPEVLTLDDFVFLQDTLVSHQSFKPFISKSTSPSPRKENGNEEQLQLMEYNSSYLSTRPTHRTVLSLGALLLQLIIGNIVPELERTSLEDMESFISVHAASKRHMEEALKCGGLNYYDILHWCFASISSNKGLLNQEFCQDFYVNVVARLEEDVENLESPEDPNS